MSDPIRKGFETISAPNFFSTSGLNRRQDTGEYVSDALADHWSTFQEGWECAIEYLKGKKNDQYSDIVSDGGMDPR